MYLILYNFQDFLLKIPMSHETDIKINLKMNAVCEKKTKKTSKSISTHPGLRYWRTRLDKKTTLVPNASLF